MPKLGGALLALSKVPTDMKAAFTDPASDFVGAMRAIATPDVRFRFMGPQALGDATGLGEVRVGVDGMIASWADWLEPFDRYVLTRRELHRLDDHRLLVVFDARVETHSTGMALDEEHAAVWTFDEEGRLAEWQAWLYAGEAKAVFGIA